MGSVETVGGGAAGIRAGGGEAEECNKRIMSQVKQRHSQLIRLGLSHRNHSMAPLLASCSSADFPYALKLFDTIPHPDTFLYNIMFRAHLRHHSPPLHLYSRMLLRHFLLPNSFTFPPLIRACTSIRPALQIHAHVLKFGLGADRVCSNNLIYVYMELGAVEEARRVFEGKADKDDAVSLTSLISGYSRWGLVEEASQLFDSIPRHSAASYNAMIATLVHHNHYNDALDLFQRMMSHDHVVLDKFVLATVLSACSGLGALAQGKWLHAYILNNGIPIDSRLATAIIDMYCKCGCLHEAVQVFQGLPSSCKGISSWNCIIGGLAMHGQGEAAILLFQQMERDQTLCPDHVTFLNLLTACAHSGLVDQGRHYFSRMTRVYGHQPTTEHYGCMVDLLGRAGLLVEAKRLIEEMPSAPDVSILGAALGACKNHRNVELGEEMARRVIELEPNNSGRYALLANLYAEAGRWEDVAIARKLMDDRAVKKAPGCSVIELDGVVTEFTAGGTVHSGARQVYAKVREMLGRIKSAGYVPDTNAMLYQLHGGSDGESPLRHHSEKLAIAFGILNTKPGATLRISKNLRICKDCHEASKFISRVYDREIIVRDRKRFHHFKGGQCSCQDYW